MIGAGAIPPRFRIRDESGLIVPGVTELELTGSGVTVSRSGLRAIASIAAGSGSGMSPSDWVEMGIYRPQDFGTVDPTGATVCHTAFQSAADAMKADNRGGVIMPGHGLFKWGAMVDLGQPTYDSAHGWGYQHSRGIVGAGRGATTIIAASGMTDPLLRVRGTTAGLPSVFIHDIAFNGNANTGMTSGVVKLNALAFSELRNVLIMGATGGTSLTPIGLLVEDCLTNVYDQLFVTNADTGLKMTTGASPYTCNMTSIRDLRADGSTAWAVDISSGDNVEIHGADIEGAGSGGGIRYSAGGNFLAGGNLWFEGTYDPLFDITASEAQIDGPNISNVTASTNVIQNRGTGKLTVYDWHEGGTCVNASGATLRKGNSNLTGSGGTTTTLY